MTIAIWAATVILSMAVLLGLFRVLTAPTLATKAVIGDLVYFCAVGILMLQGVVRRSPAWIDLALMASLVGIVATIALSRILTRGRR
ncbi:MAG: monovalent cation/H+ antiporter complex subunit F [Arachnia sp.]